MIRPRLTRTKAFVAAGLGVVLVVAAAASVAARPSSAPRLAPISADRLVATTLRELSRDPAVSGRLAVHLDLGLPAVPAGLPGPAQGPVNLLASLAGDHRLRLWTSPDGFRLAELLPASERAIFVSRTDAWAWDFDSFTAYHLGPFLGGARDSARSGSQAGLELVDPLALTRKALAVITPSTRVSVARTASVAGRDAYVLALEPRTSRTLVGRIEVAVDAERRIPLRVSVIPRGRSAAAVSAGFTSISFGAIDPSVYRFRPPPGAKVRDLMGGLALPSASKGQGIRGSAREAYPTAGPFSSEPPRLFGRDWATIVAVRIPSPSALRGSADGFDPTSLLPLSGPLLSIRLVDLGDHGWLVYGLVPQSALVAVARGLP
jgi:hypothetical protein